MAWMCDYIRSPPDELTFTPCNSQRCPDRQFPLAPLVSWGILDVHKLPPIIMEAMRHDFFAKPYFVTVTMSVDCVVRKMGKKKKPPSAP